MFTYKNVKFFYYDYYNRVMLFLILATAVLLVFGGYLIQNASQRIARKRKTENLTATSDGRSDRI